MIESFATKDKLIIDGNEFLFVESVSYPNGGISYYYAADDTAIIVDDRICQCSDHSDIFPYSLITDKQNAYMNHFRKVYRFLLEDLKDISFRRPKEQECPDIVVRGADRADNADASPLEMLFETNFTNVYGMDALKYLYKEYGITDYHGNSYFLDYLIHTKNGDYAVEENGITYHHPQVIGIERYRRQLQKQNTCTDWGIRLFRFSTEDCQYTGRIEDDIRLYFGGSTDSFRENGLLADRQVRLYDHQEMTLKDIREQREQGIHTFLVVFPTASGKSRIIEEDMREYARSVEGFKALIMAPNTNIIKDWEERIAASLPELRSRIEINTFAYMSRNYQKQKPDEYKYIVVDEAHHAVAPVLKRVIQYFTPDFLIGLTATDQRPDKQKLETVFGNYKTNLSLVEAMQQGIVAQANVYRIETNLDLSEIRFNGKDYVNADLEKSIRVTSRNDLIGDVLAQYFTDESMKQMQGVVFCVNRQHAMEMERVLNSRGISARAYTGQTVAADKVMDSFKKKEIRFLCSCNMISEGWDYPELGILVMARPTLSKVLYLQQIGRGLRKTQAKDHVYIIDVVDEYGAMAKPCSMHAIFANAMYVPFGNILKRDYQSGDMIVIDGIQETVEKIIEVDIDTFEEKYGDYLNQEQLAREFYMSTGSIISWVKKGKIKPDAQFTFGNRKIYLFSPDSVNRIRLENGLKEHNELTIRADFFDFLHERDYTLSYKMPFLLAVLNHMNSVGDASIDEVLTDYIAFYEDRIRKNLPVDRPTCPYTIERLKDRSFIRQNMLTNPFEKFERKRFLYYSKDLGMISMNHALLEQLKDSDYQEIRQQLKEDIENYYQNLEA